MEMKLSRSQKAVIEMAGIEMAAGRNRSGGLRVEGVTIRTEVPMIDMKSAAAKAETEAAADDLAAQVANLRADLSRLTESVAALGSGAKTYATEEANMMLEKTREKVREEPLFMLAATAGVAYILGLMARRRAFFTDFAVSGTVSRKFRARNCVC